MSEKKQLTKREKEIVRIIMEGKMLKEITGLLGIAISTLNTHMSHIHLKTGTRSIAELIIWALKHPGEI